MMLKSMLWFIRLADSRRIEGCALAHSIAWLWLWRRLAMAATATATATSIATTN